MFISALNDCNANSGVTTAGCAGAGSFCCSFCVVVDVIGGKADGCCCGGCRGSDGGNGDTW